MSLKDKIIAFDLDGTLVRNNACPSEYTCNEIKRLNKEGYHITIVTGRAPISSRSIYNACGMNMLSVHNNGAVVYDFINEKKIRNITIPSEVINEVLNCDELMEHLNDIMLEINDQVYSLKGNVVWQQNQIVGDLRKTLPELPNSLNFFAHTHDEQPIIQEIVDKLCKDYHYRYWWLQGEFYNIHFSKREGVMELLKYYNKTSEDLVFFGDAENDNETLQYAGIGVAMKNASDDVKSYANQVTEFTNEEDGAVKHLLKMIEEEN